MLITHIFQPPKSRICGQCSVAMITGKPISEVLKVFGHKHGTITKEVVSTLRTLGVTCSDQRRSFSKSIPKLCIIHVSKKNVRHWAVYHEGTVYCSSLGVYSFEEYSSDCRINSCIEIVSLAPSPLASSDLK